jgi:hypothetical protein
MELPSRVKIRKHNGHTADAGPYGILPVVSTHGGVFGVEQEVIDAQQAGRPYWQKRNEARAKAKLCVLWDVGTQRWVGVFRYRYSLKTGLGTVGEQIAMAEWR